MVTMENAFRTLLYSTLNGNSALRSALVGGIHDGAVPDTSAVVFPYLVIGEGTEGPDNRLSTFGRNMTLALHIWSRYRGNKEGATLAGQIIALLDQGQGRLTMTGWIINSLSLEMNESMMDDVDQFHHILRFRCRAQPST